MIFSFIYMIAQTHDSGSNNNTLAEAMNIQLEKHCIENNENFNWNHKTHRVQCVCHKLALVVSSGLQAPPPPLVKSTMLGDFPIPTTTLQSIAEEDDTKEGPGVVQPSDEEDLEEVDDSDLQPAATTTDWYDVIDGLHEEISPAREPSATNCNAANAIDLLMTKVSLLFLSFNW